MSREKERDYLDSGGVTGVGLMMLELKLLRLLRLLAWLVAADRRELEEIIGRLAGRGMAPGGRLPRTGKSGGLEAPIEEKAAVAALWRRYISRPGRMPAAPATRGGG